MLLGAPRTGKTRLQSRYTLRQFVDINSEHAQRMGGHKHLRLLDGTDVHLIIHELRTGRGRATADAEDSKRKRLLEQSDAVMLAFNPWSRDTFEWISGKIVDDILYTGQKKQLSSDVVRLLDDLASAMSKRTKSNRSALPSSYVPKRLPRRPDEPEDRDSEVPLFPGGDEKRYEHDHIDYGGELKRISIVVEGAILKNAGFMVHEKDLPSPPPHSPTPSPLHVPSPTRMNDRRLATTTKVSEGARTAKKVAVLMDRKHLPIMKHDSVISMQSSIGGSSTYSQSEFLPVVYDRRASASPASSEAHPALRPTTVREPYEALMRRKARTPTGETEIPVLVVATMTDRLKDGGGALERRVTAEEGQRLARMFGRNCAYIETSARSNANVDEAYGIIVDQVMAKRAVARRDDLARARLEAAIQAIHAEGGRSGGDGRTGTGTKARERTCVPGWGWLLARVPVPSWDTIAGALFAGRRRPAEDGGSVTGAQEDVWGEKAEVKRKSHAAPSERQSRSLSSRKPAAQQLMGDRTSRSFGSTAGSSLGARTMSHDAARDIPLSIIDETISPSFDQDGLTWQSKSVMPAILDATQNPFVSDESERPMKVATVTTLEEGTMTTETRAQRRRTDVMPGLSRKPSQKRSRTKSSIIEGGLSSLDQNAASSSTQGRSRPKSSSPPRPQEPIHRKSSQRQRGEHHLHRRHPDGPPPRRSRPRRSRVSELPPSLPPLEFDAAVDVDDRRASASVLARPANRAPEAEQIAAFLSQDAAASRDTFVMVLSPPTAARTLSQLVREIDAARVAGGAGSVVPSARDGGVPRRRQSGRGLGGGVPGLPYLPGMGRDEEEEGKKRETPGDPETSDIAVSRPAFTPSPAQRPRLDVGTKAVEAYATLPPLQKSDLRSNSKKTTASSSSPPRPKQTPTPLHTTAIPEETSSPILIFPRAAVVKSHSPSLKHAVPFITTTTGARVSGSDKDRRQNPPTGRRLPPKPKGARPKPKGSAGAMAPPPPPPQLKARAQKPNDRSLSAWI